MIQQKTACAYYRTSSKTNVQKEGARPEDYKDTLPRQQEAVRAYALANDIKIVAEYYDADEKGETPVTNRAGFNEMLEYMLGNGARTVLIETVGRFARDLIIQLLGHDLLLKENIALVPVDAPAYFMEDTSTARMIRQILGAVSEWEKATLVAKMRSARERKKVLTGRCEGRKPPLPNHVAMAKALKNDGASLRTIASLMAMQGMVQRDSQKAYGASSIKLMLDGRYDREQIALE